MLRKPLPEKWWIYADKRPKLYRTITPLERILVHTRLTKTHALSFCENTIVFSDAIVVFTYPNTSIFSPLQSSLHESWAWQYSSTMKGDRRYAPSDCFETFPFPQNICNVSDLDQIGGKYYAHRRQLMLKMRLGLTKTYNQFHNKQLVAINDDLPEKEMEKKYGKETINLWNHLRKTENTCSFNEAVEGILELRRLHREMDETVLKAYDWTDLNLAHDFYEVDYLPENDRIRYTISPAARREILKRLLKLNHEIREKEASESQSTLLKKKSPKGKKIKINSQQIPLF